MSNVQIGKPNIVDSIEYKGVSPVSIISEHVKDLTIKMATTKPTTSSTAYYRGVTFLL